ncbi:MAG: hypothetical protein NZM38_09125 [Cytophagales bacterium]|nr:hypothetical protein [Cytophagales bacterium]MDW8384920.1 hypothetical protein [Flammeovirgaceae bacterium]
MQYWLLSAFLLITTNAIYAQVAKRRIFQSPPVLFVATKTDDGKIKLLLQDTREMEFHVYDRNTRSSKQYPINNYLIELDELPQSGYISFQKNEGNEIITYGSMEINTIRYMEPKIFSMRARNYQKYVAKGGYAMPAVGTNVASNRKGTLKIKTNPDIKAGEDDKTIFEFDETQEIKAQPRVSKPPIEIQEAVESSKEEIIDAEIPTAEIEKAPEQPKEKVIYTAKHFESFLQKSRSRLFEKEYNRVVANIQNSNLSPTSKAKKLELARALYDRDIRWLNSEKWLRERKKTADKITTDFEIEEMYDDYVLLRKGNEYWIYDQYNYLYEMKGVNQGEIKIVETHFDEKKIEHNKLTLKSSKLPCEVVIKNEGEIQHILYGDIDLGDFVGKRQYDIQLDISNQNALVIKSSKGNKYNFVLHEKEINIQYYKADKKIKEEKIPVKSYCMTTDKKK